MDRSVLRRALTGRATPVRPADLACAPAAGERPPAEFPRDAGWRPAAPLRLFARRSPEPAGPRWHLGRRHRPGDAATAEVRSAELHFAGDGGPHRVVVKRPRPDPALNASGEAIARRFDAEQKALNAVPPDAGPTSWTPSGLAVGADSAPRLGLPVVHCLAANHTLGLPATDDDGGLNFFDAGAREEALGATLGRDDSACRGCRLWGRPEACRAWVVSNGPPGEWEAAAVPAGPMLILDDLGDTLQSHFDVPAERPEADRFAGKVAALASLADALAKVHAAGWGHLDINPDNLCVRPGGFGMTPIDFGHAEPFGPRGLEVYGRRTPLRRVDFAAPEMKVREFPVNITPADRDGQGRDVFELHGLLGWPRTWLPDKGDAVEVADPGGDPAGAPLLRVAQRSRADSRSEAMRLTVEPWEAGVEYRVPRSAEAATVYRAARPGSDAYSFGLVLLCWLLDTPRPVTLEAELAVFSRAVVQARVVLGEDNWQDVYKRAFGLHSVLLDSALPMALNRLPSKSSARALKAAVRVGVRCIVRDGNWGYLPANTAVFRAAADDLGRVARAVGVG